MAVASPPSYPSNDITDDLREAAAKGGSGAFTLDDDSVIHQVIPVENDLDLDLNGLSLKLYGRTQQVAVYGRPCTGPAGWFLDAAGNPIGYPGSNTQHPAGVQFNIFQTVGADVANVQVHDGTLNGNITAPVDPTTGRSTDAWGGALFMPSGSAGGHKFSNVKFVNNYGGLNWYPDPIHLDAPNMIVTNYESGLHTTIPTQPTVHGGVPGGLIGGGPHLDLPGIAVSDVTMAGFLELDGILSGHTIADLKCTHILIGNSTPAGSWGGSLWNGVHASWPATAGPVLNFDNGVATDWTIENSIFNGTIDGAENFKGTWATSNTPSSLSPPPPSSGGGGGAALFAALAGLGLLAIGAHLTDNAQRNAPGRAPYVRVVA